MRLKIALIVAGGFYLFLLGFRPDALPFPRHDERAWDAVISHWPAAHFFQQSIIEDREFPLWRETTMAGQPFAANPLNKTAYPFQWLLLLLSPAVHLNTLIAMHLFIAAAGMWLWVRSLGWRIEVAAFCAVAYGLSPRIIGHTGAGHLDVVYALAWWPWLMWAVHRAGKPTIQAALLLALIAGLLFLADVRISLFAFVSAAVYAFLDYGGLSKKQLPLIVTPLIFLLLTLSLILPLLSWSPYLNRGGLTAADAGDLSLQPLQLLGLLLPIHRPSIEASLYVGLPVFGLSVFGLAMLPRRTQLAWIGLFIFVVFYALGVNGPLWPLLVRLFPSLLWFRVPPKIWLIMTLLLPLLAGYGLENLLSRLNRRPVFPPAVRFWVVVFMLVMGLLGLLALLIIRLPLFTAVHGLIFAPLLGVVLLLALSSRLRGQKLAYTLIALVFVELAWVGYQYTEWRGPEVWLEPGRPLAEHLLTEEPARIYSPAYSLEQQIAAAYDLKIFGGVDPFQLKGVVDAVEQGSGVKTNAYSVVIPALVGPEGASLEEMNRDAIIDTRVLAEWNVSHIVAPYRLDNPRLTYADTVNGIYIYRNQDYLSDSTLPTIPDWPENWPGLPDAETVADLNQLTLTTSLVSGITFLICLGLLAFFFVRGKLDG